MTRLHYTILFLVLATTFLGEFYLLNRSSQGVFAAGATTPAVEADDGTRSATQQQPALPR